MQDLVVKSLVSYRVAMAKLGEKGQNTLEYIGLAIIAALVILVIAGQLGGLGTALQTNIAKITGLTTLGG